MSVSSKRFILDEDGVGIAYPVNQVAGKVTQRRRKGRRSSKYSLRSLQELDETVASVGSKYQSPRRPGEDDLSSVGSCANTLVTSDGHAIYTHRNLIENMPQVKRGGRSNELYSVKSQRTKTSNRSKKSRGSRLKRGNSLERSISRTILQTAAAGVEAAHFLVRPEGNSSSGEIPVDFILHDLVRIDNLIHCESVSVKNRVRSKPPRERASLSGSFSSEVSKDKDFLNDTATTTPFITGSADIFSLGKPQEFDAITPVTSDETPPQGSEATASPKQNSHFDLNESLDDPFTLIDLQQFQVSASYSNCDDEVMENHAYFLPKEESFLLTSKAYNTKRTAASKHPTLAPSSTDPMESLFDVDDSWTTFEGNPFEDSFPLEMFNPKESSHGDSSRRSPSSILDFGMQRREERQLGIAFSQSTETAFSLTSTMVLI
jgi:hypothetical protein